jgi:tetratricopeptide (TPR) repeat protein
VIAAFLASLLVAPGATAEIPDAIEAFNIGAVEARTGALLLSGQAGGEVEGALTWTVSQRGDNGRSLVPFAIEVDGESLLSGRIGRNLAIGLYAYVVDDDGVVVDHIAQGLVLDSSEYSQRIIDFGLKFVGRFELVPGNYALRVMVRNQRTGEFFMSWSLLSLPSPDDPGPQLLPPLFPDTDSGWVVAKQAGLDAAAIVLGDDTALVAAARPVLVEDKPVDVWLGGGGWGRDARVGIRIINDKGRTVSEPVVEVTGEAVGDFEFRRAELSPVDLPPGDYTLVVTMSDDQAGEELRRGVSVVAVSLKNGDAWVVVRRSEDHGTMRVAEPAGEEAPKVSKKEIRNAYRTALAVLGDGDAVSARRQVAELERRAVAGSSPKAVSNLAEAEYAESKALAKGNPMSLMPMAMLHRELYRSYMARQEGMLGFHARKMAITYAEQLARLKPENGFSEGLMVNLAADLAQAGASSAARDLLEQTLRLNPGYRPALLSLGFSFERNGQYIEAATTYRRLVDTHPDFDEGLLRLGINLIRTGRDEQGVKLLQGILRRGARPWVKAVAAQEMVRYLVDQDYPGEAEAAARSALVSMADDQRLMILLAAILEQSGRHNEAVAAVADLPPATRGVSPRARYGEWPALGVRASQSNLTARAVEAMPALKAAIDATGGAR